MWQGVPTDDLISFIFETLLNESAVKQIKECAPLLKGLLDASTDKRFTQFAVLKGVTELVTAPKYGEAVSTLQTHLRRNFSVLGLTDFS